jgi:hypothetical protein
MQILEGHFSADDSARLCRNYRYACERMTRIMAGWIALTPELSAKLLLGRHVWDSAQHADAWGKRLPELRARAQESEPANAAFAAFMDAIEAPDAPAETVERLAGVYRVLKPHLVAAYVKHLESANPVYEPPTCRILRHCIEDEDRHIRGGETVIRHLTVSPEARARVARWQIKLQCLLETARGVTGQGLPPTAAALKGKPVPLSDDAQEFIRLEHAVEKWAIPEDLEIAVRAFGDALVDGDGLRLGRFLDAAADATPLLALRDVRPVRHHTAAFAKLGRHRIVKYRLDGLAGAVTLSARWEHREAGWRVGAVDLVKVEQPKPA